MKNYYNILGVDKDASKEEIREAYKKLSAKLHPDKNGGDDYFCELFKNINEANQVLSNDDKRSEYDFKLNTHHLKNIEWHFHNEHKQHAPGAKGRRINQAKKSITVLVGLLVVAGLAGLISLFISIVKDDEFRLSAKARQPAEVFDTKEPKINTPINPAKETVPPLQDSAPNLEPSRMEVDREYLTSELLEKKQSSTASNFAEPAYQDPLKQETNTSQHTAMSPKSDLSVAGGITPSISHNDAISSSSEKTTRLTEKQIDDIINSVTVKKNAFGSSVNCVRVLKTSNSNIENAFDIVGYLKNKGFVIAGRETISKKLHGVQVEVNGSCIVVTVGIVKT